MSKTNNESRNQHIVRPENRRREPLPKGEVKIRAPKPPGSVPTKPSLILLLPTVGGPIFMGVALMFSASGGVNLLGLVGIVIGLLSGGVQWWKYQGDQQKHTQEAKQREESYRAYLSQVEQQLEGYAEQQRRIVWQENPSVNEMMKRAEKQENLLWERLPDDDDFLSLRVGTSDLPLSVEIKVPDVDEGDPLVRRVIQLNQNFSRLPDLPVTSHIKTLGTLGVRGQRPEESLQMAYTLITHLVTHHSPDTVRLYVISHRPYAEREWGWVRWLPHTGAIRGTEGEAPRLSFSPDTDDGVLGPLSQILRHRLDEQHRPGSRRYGEADPHLVIILDQVPDLRGHLVLTTLLGHKPGREGNRIQASGIFVDNPPPQVNGLVWVRSGELEYRETWMSDANQVFVQGTAELIPLDRVEQFARHMAPLRTEASYTAGGGGLPSSVRLVELLGATQPLEINLEKLYGEKYDPKKVMSFPIGLNVDLKPMIIILREDGQGGYGHHAMLAGGTGKGKSVTLQSIVLSLAANNSPAHLNFVLADFKGGASELARLKNLPHVVGFVTDLDEAYVERFRQSLEGEVRRRKKIFDSTPQTIGRQIQNIYEYNKVVDEPLPHLVVVIDEFAKALQINPDFKTTMDKDIAAQGRALGIHLILSTQKAADFASVRQNVEVRMSMQTNTAEDSKTIFNRDDAARKLTRAGQAFLQVGDNRIFEMFQAARADTAFVSEGTVNLDLLDDFTVHHMLPDGRRELLYRHKVGSREERKTGNALSEAEVLVEHIRKFCAERQYPEQRIICQPPLSEPTKMPVFPLLTDYSAYCRWQMTSWDVKQKAAEHRLKVPLGMLDVPGEQDQRPFFLDLTQRDGNYLIAGPTGSGKGLFLRTLVLALAASHPPDDLLFYFLGRGAGLSVFETLPHCQALIQASETERMRRFFTFLQQEESRRSELLRDHKKDNMVALRHTLPNHPLPTLVIIFEDFAGFITENAERLTEIEGLAARGKQVDLHLILSVPAIRVVHTRIQQSILNRMVLGVKLESDTIDILGKRAKPLPEVAGRGYIVQDQEMLECQIAAPARRAGIKPDSAEATAEIHEIVTAMNRGWAWPEGKRPLPAIGELSRYVELEPLWQQHRTILRLYEQPTAPIGLDYTTLEPVSIDFLALEQHSLVVGPLKSGKTDFLVTLCLATAYNIPPDLLEIDIFAFKADNPLQHLKGLPHVRFSGNARTAKNNLTELKADLEQRVINYRQTVDQTTSTNIMGLYKTTPKRFLLVIDDLLLFSRTDELNRLVDQCMETGGELSTMHLMLADTSNGLTQVKQNFGIKYMQNAGRSSSGAVFSAEQSDLTTSNLMGRIPTPTTKLHAPHIGKGRAFWAYKDQIRVVQFARVGPENSNKERYDEEVRKLVEMIIGRYSADSNQESSATIVQRLP